MLLLKVAPVLLLVIAVGADKKIELQDIEDDNLKSEKETEKSEPRSQNVAPPSGPGSALDFLKSGILRYFDSPQPSQQPRYVQQYAVTEPPERIPVATPKSSHYGGHTPQQPMIGYLSNLPMQIYLVPQYYNEPSEQAASSSSSVQYQPSAPRAPSYQTAPESNQQGNYVEAPSYVTPSAKGYVQPYSSPPALAYLTYAHPTHVVPAPATIAPVLAYPLPVTPYPTALITPPVPNKGYYSNPRYADTNTVDETPEDSEEKIPSQTEIPYTGPSSQEYPRYYSSRNPIREESRHGSISELPHPNPILLKGPPSHLSHIPKALPLYRPINKPVYAAGGNLIPSFTPRPHETYGIPSYKRKPTSLLDSYVPSGLQVEYLKRGYAKDPLIAYDALSSGRHYGPPVPLQPRHFERGFLPNQMYHTAAGGITYGHYKRSPKIEKIAQ